MALNLLLRSRVFSSLYQKINPLVYPKSDTKLFIELDHISSLSEKEWLSSELSYLVESPLPLAQRLNALSMIQMEESLDSFLQKKFSTFKRYSCEGTESIHAGLYSVFSEYSSGGPKSIILTLTHRGKISLMAGLLKYPLRLIFAKIQGRSLIPEELNKHFYYYLDDLIQNQPFSCKRPEFLNLNISMNHMPCHLELAGPISMGKTRAKIDNGVDSMHVWVHGDGSVAGQGVVYEAVQMSHLDKYKVNGTLHIVENNQIGFTANEMTERSSTYCTDIFKIIGAPVIHVNAKSVDDVIRASVLGVRYRNKFQNDFAIDLVGYRKYGHNEVDDPTITNPLMYKSIKKLRETADEYEEQLIREGLIGKDYLEKLKNLFEHILNEELTLSKSENIKEEIKHYFFSNNFQGNWTGFTPFHHDAKIKTGVSLEVLHEISNVSMDVPYYFELHHVIKKNFKERSKLIENRKVDWSLSEVFAFGSLMKDGFNVRLSGEDVVRGTFSHRNIGIVCQSTEQTHFPLSKLGPGKLTAVNSLLSELGVLSFEYGYSLESPSNLIVWESQYGDFSNVAQSLIDTCISNSEAKTGRQSGLVVLLPHGQEGMGSDHSSALIERYLSLVNDPLSVQLNIEVANVVFPSNYFHLLRKSMLRNFRRPIVICTPKLGLRHKATFSSLEDFTDRHGFRPVVSIEKGKGSAKLVLCSGKVFIDLYERFENISLLVVEQLAPLPFKELKELTQESGKNIVWVQEEPENFGVWRFIEKWLKEIDSSTTVVSRPKMSASAAGNLDDFLRQKEELLSEVNKFAY